MEWKNGAVSHEYHYTLVYGDETVSEWREVSVGQDDGPAFKFIETLVADIAKEMVKSRQAECVWYHGLVLSEFPLSSGAFCGEVFEHEGEVCIVDIGGTGLWVDIGKSPLPQIAP